MGPVPQGSGGSNVYWEDLTQSQTGDTTTAIIVMAGRGTFPPVLSLSTRQPAGTSSVTVQMNPSWKGRPATRRQPSVQTPLLPRGGARTSIGVSNASSAVTRLPGRLQLTTPSRLRRGGLKGQCRLWGENTPRSQLLAPWEGDRMRCLFQYQPPVPSSLHAFASNVPSAPFSCYW